MNDSIIFTIYGINWKKKKLKKTNENFKKSIKDEEDGDVILFRTSIFKDEKQKGDDEGFVILDKEVRKKSKVIEEQKEEEKKNDENNVNISENEVEKLSLSKSDDENEENVIIYDKGDNEKEEIYGPSPLVENVHKMEDEEEYNLVLEGLEEQKGNDDKDDFDI